MRIIASGISGTGQLPWLRELCARAEQRGRHVRLFDVREAMFEVARNVGEPVDEGTILDMFPRALVLLRATALEKICAEVERLQDAEQDWILNTHAVFRWKNTLISGFDPHYLSRLNPHLFITLTSGVKEVHRQLRQQPRWHGLTEEDVLTWREEEQFFTEEMARIHRKRQVLLPRAMDPEAAFRVCFEPAWKRAYLSYPMQHVLPGQERQLARFKAQLSQHLVVFDPADVNDFALPGSDGGREATAELAEARDAELPGNNRVRLQQHIADQIVQRDYKLIDQSDMVVVYYDAPVPSPGVISEMKFALESGKQVYGVWLPEGEPSVFFTRYCSTWFRSTEQLFEHFQHHRVAERAN